MNKIEQAIREQFQDNFETPELFKKWLKDTIFTISFEKTKVFVNDGYFDGYLEDKDCLQIKTTSKSSGIQNTEQYIPQEPNQKTETETKTETNKNDKNIVQNNYQNSPYGRLCSVFLENEEIPAIFHTWGTFYNEDEKITYTVAIVEFSDGSIAQVLPSHFHFRDIFTY